MTARKYLRQRLRWITPSGTYPEQILFQLIRLAIGSLAADVGEIMNATGTVMQVLLRRTPRRFGRKGNYL
ncbi:MAG: hypothetical protein JSU90_10650 [Nitrospiraceae bacterium]|nr:MAG: hypothetical protein JSU90_10650 [Nitrospiraceae bacterium]